MHSSRIQATGWEKIINLKYKLKVEGQLQDSLSGGEERPRGSPAGQAEDEEEPTEWREVRELLETAFLETDESYAALVRKSGSPPSMVRSGTTAMVCYIAPDLGTVHVANAGDCRCVLASNGLPKARPWPSVYPAQTIRAYLTSFGACGACMLGSLRGSLLQ